MKLPQPKHPKAVKALLTAGAIVGEVAAQAINIVIYAAFSVLLTFGLDYGLHLHVNAVGLLALLYPGAFLAKLVIRDLGRTYGSASYRGQVDVITETMVRQARLQAEQAVKEAEANAEEEAAIKRAMELLGKDDGDDGLGGVMATPHGPYL